MKLQTILIGTLLGMISTQGLAADRLGLGVIVGEPTGLSVKYWLDEKNAIDGAVAWSLSDNDAFQLHADYLWHDYDLIDSGTSGKLPVYYGLGARLKFKDNRHHDDETIFGIRFPLGISYLFDEAPFDLFLEVVPVLDLSPDVDVDLDAAIGLRFYFD